MTTSPDDPELPQRMSLAVFHAGDDLELFPCHKELLQTIRLNEPLSWAQARWLMSARYHPADIREAAQDLSNERMIKATKKGFVLNE